MRLAAERCAALLREFAPFFGPILDRHPEWPARLAADDLARTFDVERYRGRFAAQVAAGAGDATAGPPLAPADTARALREFKYYELARITLRELSTELVPAEREGEVLAELSHLADTLLDAALEAALRRVAGSVGLPRWRTAAGRAVTLSFCALGLGKLGSEELNYSSDVDLVYVYGAQEEIDLAALEGGPSGQAPSEYFARVAQEFGRLVGGVTGDGFLYRVDLDLRPNGSQGDLVVSEHALVEYYELWADTWEKAAFMKARPVAGDASLGWRAIRQCAPLIYRSSMDFTGVAAIRAMKEKVAQAHETDAGTFNVKVGAGGIRDIECIAQALQLLHGGRVPQLRGRSTQAALASLGEAGILPEGDVADLLAAYRFLRRVENRLQMYGERQVHRLPLAGEALERVARSMALRPSRPPPEEVGAETPGEGGGGASRDFLLQLARHRGRVRDLFARLFRAEGSGRVAEMFARNVPQLFGNPAARGNLEELARRFEQAIGEGVDAQRALNNLDRFIRGVGNRRFYFQLLLDRPELVPRLTTLFASSEYLSACFATHPRLIEPIFSDPNVLLLDRSQLKSELEEIRAELAREKGGDATERALDAMRLFHNRELINVGLLDLAGKVTRREVEGSLTEIAEVCIEAGLELARLEMKRRGKAPRGEFLIVGMGKLASRELTYGSDLDVIFLYETRSGAESEEALRAQEYFVRLAQKLIWALRTRTAQGVCYEIDARLRPSGNQGMLVTSLSGLARYHAGSAQVWERQALLRARPVAGSKRLGKRFEALRRKILSAAPATGVREEIHRVRQRTEAELGRRGEGRHDFKTGRGGMHDVESVVQCLQLLHGARFPDLWNVDPVDAQIDRLEQHGLLAAGDARTLRQGWDFLQRLSSRLRIVENRSISDLDEERGDLESLALRLGYESPQREGGARRALIEEYRRRTGAIREVYQRLVAEEPGEA